MSLRITAILVFVTSCHYPGLYAAQIPEGPSCGQYQAWCQNPYFANLSFCQNWSQECQRERSLIDYEEGGREWHVELSKETSERLRENSTRERLLENLEAGMNGHGGSVDEQTQGCEWR